MNARRLYALMRERFPSVDFASLEWINVVDERGCLSRDRVLPVVGRRFESRGIQEVLVQVHRKLGSSELLRS